MKNWSLDIVLQINGQERIGKSLKYLGVIIENKNKWNRSRHDLQKIAKIVPQIRGSTRTIYTVAIEPILTYACHQAWSSDFKTKRAETLSIQRSFAISIIKGYRTISTKAAISPFSNRLHPALSTNIESRNCPQHHRIDISQMGLKLTIKQAGFCSNRK
ncbi:hypothetical protein DERP_003319 [Dermatophagoides pteronyssinus]|uniref:Uncharacterized protein n=1 Tax=Dermatophagoides pteronyssinus TaxID=6956 RepID=A0ABQ8JJG2_DERPT|nr:hypothetical protein DERP_003319 [Dermatophagoides pteronyssinus]